MKATLRATNPAARVSVAVTTKVAPKATPMKPRAWTSADKARWLATTYTVQTAKQYQAARTKAARKAHAALMDAQREAAQEAQRMADVAAAGAKRAALDPVEEAKREQRVAQARAAERVSILGAAKAAREREGLADG
jgi:hypothetical protein